MNADERVKRLQEIADGTQSAAWLVYAWDYGPYAISLHDSPQDAAREAAVAGYGNVARWPFGMELADAITAWEGR